MCADLFRLEDQLQSIMYRAEISSFIMEICWWISAGRSNNKYIIQWKSADPFWQENQIISIIVWKSADPYCGKIEYVNMYRNKVSAGLLLFMAEWSTTLTSCTEIYSCAIKDMHIAYYGFSSFYKKNHGKVNPTILNDLLVSLVKKIIIYSYKKGASSKAIYIK